MSTEKALRTIHNSTLPVAHGVPDEVLNDEELQRDISELPANYNFEVFKTVWRIRKANAKRVALQMPEGFLIYANLLSDIISRHCSKAETVILGDVTYGACCVDDFTATALGCDFLVHYGHSCLVPVQNCRIPMLYVFVDIKFDPGHLKACILKEFSSEYQLALLGTIQFVSTIQQMKPLLRPHFKDIVVPQAKPLSPGELLGCTAPRLENMDAIVYVADGRFHLESVMIANPGLPAYKYDPYSKLFTKEDYNHSQMMGTRRKAVEDSKNCTNFGIILGTLGRQGSTRILDRLCSALTEAGKNFMVLLVSELKPEKLSLMEASVEAWIQIACPRLSIDWGYAFSRPLLTPYEAYVAIGKVQWRQSYPMDYYKRGGEEWTNYYRPSS
eukprot:Plantae.Rhodophyta-Purpureofilum_apyrenoidigerum.ctg4881.p1 GENE.Plantae.Rhodophyta-Purpureofilum_apyrenoidigerum.ctg4881~~Plantae.Rhodophyta-Purpureofilum_apyrenoidigerum.ctg4881.p1  ORF type:complete len:386 (+),score=57.85 Plantae.Rhodophyta-Purpureofilum_apyrenoidigerum.ctg4881:293-1450(+)